MKKRAVIYARFSSYGQTEQSIEGQLRECYAFAKRNDLMIVGEYIDRAMTGTSDHRPDFLKMIEDSKKKSFDFVLVYQLDRFAHKVCIYYNTTPDTESEVRIKEKEAGSRLGFPPPKGSKNKCNP